MNMCDCYGHKCEFCHAILAMHLEDYATPREDIGVLCPSCLKRHENFLHGKAYTIFKNIVDEGKKIGRWAVIYWTEIAQGHRDGNTPNTEQYEIEIEIKTK
jgi:hypothetical protein